MLRKAIACLLLLAPIAPAAAQDDIMSHLISNPSPRTYRVDGVNGGAQVRNDAGVQGGKALRVIVPAANVQTWATAVAVPVTRGVHNGDALILAFWARLEPMAGGSATASLPYNSVQLSTAPYTALFTGPATLTPQWQMFEIHGRAAQDYAANALTISLHLATGHQTIDIGPVFLLDMGPNGS
jgi:hypothetical protein